MCCVQSGGGKCYSPVTCASACTASSSSSPQTIAVSGPFQPVCISAPVVIGEATATERSPPICEGEPCEASSSSVRLGWNAIL